MWGAITVRVCITQQFKLQNLRAEAWDSGEEMEYLIIHPVTLPFCSELPNWTLEDICTDAHVGKFDWFMNYFYTVNLSRQRWKLIILY